MSGFLGMFVGGAAAPGPVTIGAVTILSSTSVSVAFIIGAVGIPPRPVVPRAQRP